MGETELIFEVREDEIDGGYTARALGCSIFTEAETLEELRKNVREAGKSCWSVQSSASQTWCSELARHQRLA